MQTQPDLLLKQQEFAHIHHLGTLEGEYAATPRKLLANFAWLLAAVMLVGSFPMGRANFMASGLAILLVGGIIPVALYFHYRHLHIATYTYGLLYLNGRRCRVIYWQQMYRAYTMKGFLAISLRQEVGLFIPCYVSKFGKLRARVKQHLAAPGTAPRASRRVL